VRARERERDRETALSLFLSQDRASDCTQPRILEKNSQGFFDVSSRSNTFEMGAADLPVPFFIIRSGDLMPGQTGSAKIRKKQPNPQK
jgi:hypothetical protein